LGHGGLTYRITLVGGSAERMAHGLQDLQHVPHDPAGDRIRRPGGGKKKTATQQPEVIDHVQQLLEDRRAGDPMRPSVLWTDFTPRDISVSLQQEGRPSIGTRVVRRILSDLGCVRRQSAQGLPGSATAERDPPLGSSAQRQAPLRAAGHPVWSIATKTKACLGTLYRNGKVYGPPAQKACDHDFPSGAEGVMVPQGMYDGARNHGGLQVGLSRDTTAFACDSLRVDWESDGQQDDPQASALLLLGVSAAAPPHMWKEQASPRVSCYPRGQDRGSS